MQLKNFYLHAAYGNDGTPFNEKKTFENLEKILQSGAILSRRKMKDTSPEKSGWNGLDYISICDYSRRNNPPYENRDYFRGYTAYNLYIKNSISFILRKEKIEAIKPILMPPAIFDWDSQQRMRALGNHPTKRYSDLPDELQVKDEISLENVEGLTIPLTYFYENPKGTHLSQEEIKRVYRKLKSLLAHYQKEYLIYDLDSTEEIEDEQKIEYLLKKQK